MTRKLLLFAGFVLLLAIPYQAGEFWLQTGLYCMAAAIAAIGLQILVGTTGQLSLGHAFFVAIGAYVYSWLSADKPPPLLHDQPSGVHLPPWLALIGAVLAAGAAGALFSPVSSRLRGLYLGLASLGLVFIGQHILTDARAFSGGFNGRAVTEFSVFGFHFSDNNPDNLSVFGVEYGYLERLWYLGLALVALSWWLGRNIVRSRAGRALQAVRDSQIAAGTMGIDVRVYKAAAFTVSSMFAGLGGVFLALASQAVVPEQFGFTQSIDFLVMIVLGGLGSIGGAIAGAVAVSALPYVFDHYADSLPLVADPGASGLQGGEAARLLYGAAVIAIMIFAPRGLAGLSQRFERKQRPPTPLTPTVTTTKESTA